jgi:hypothetical protein
MLRIDPEIIAKFASPLWIAVGSTALLVIVVCGLALHRPNKGLAGAVERTILIALAAVFTGSLTWACFDGAVLRAERNALDMRAGQLTAQAITTGSMLACLDPLSGDTVEGACEREVFASPERVAAATSYVAAQFVLLTDMAGYRKRGGSDIDGALVSLRRTLEADPFGFLAHVLVTREGCTSDNCAALALLHDLSHVRTNLIAQTFDHFVDHYREVWGKSPDTLGVAATNAAIAGTAEANVPGKHKVVVNIDFPTAASIPPISIMNPEPKAPAAAARPAGAAAHPGKPGAQAGAVPPAADGAKVEPVWTPAPAQATQ